KPAGNLVLDDDKRINRNDGSDARFNVDLPVTYLRLAVDPKGTYGNKPVGSHPWVYDASRYVWKFQSRRSLLIWKVFGQRLDGFSNDDFPIEAVPGDPNSLQLKGQPLPNTPQNRSRAVLAYHGSVMPPPEAVAGTYVGPDGKKIKVAPLTPADRLTLVRWVDLGCPLYF